MQNRVVHFGSSSLWHLTHVWGDHLNALGRGSHKDNGLRGFGQDQNRILSFRQCPWILEVNNGATICVVKSLLYFRLQVTGGPAQRSRNPEGYLASHKTRRGQRAVPGFSRKGPPCLQQGPSVFPSFFPTGPQADARSGWLSSWRWQF